MHGDWPKPPSLQILSCKCTITQSLLLRSGKLKQITFLVSQFSLFSLNKKTDPSCRVPFGSERTRNNIWCWFMWEEVLTLVWAMNGFESHCPVLWWVWRQKFIAAELATPRKLKGSGNFSLLFPARSSYGNLLAPPASAPCLMQELTDLESSSHTGGWRSVFTTSGFQAGCETTWKWSSVPELAHSLIQGLRPENCFRPNAAAYSLALAMVLARVRNDLFGDSLCGHLPLWRTTTVLLLCSPHITFLRGEHHTPVYFQLTISLIILNYSPIKPIYFFHYCLRSINLFSVLV